MSKKPPTTITAIKTELAQKRTRREELTRQHETAQADAQDAQGALIAGTGDSAALTGCTTLSDALARALDTLDGEIEQLETDLKSAQATQAETDAHDRAKTTLAAYDAATIEFDKRLRAFAQENADLMRSVPELATAAVRADKQTPGRQGWMRSPLESKREAGDVRQVVADIQRHIAGRKPIEAPSVTHRAPTEAETRLAAAGISTSDRAGITLHRAGIQ